MKNKVEAQPRKVNKKNSVVKPTRDVDVKHSLLNANSEPICATCKKSIFDGVHDMITSPNVVPLKKTTSHSVETQKPELEVYSMKTKNVKNVGSSKKAKIVESKNANHSEPNHTWGSNATDIPSSSYLVMTGKSKKSSHQPKAKDTNQEKLYLLHMNLYGPMRMASINGKKYILVIVDDYSRFTWVRFLRTKDEAPEAIIKCIKNIQVRLNATVRNVQPDNGTEFVNQSLREFYENVGISHQRSVARTPQQNDQSIQPVTPKTLIIRRQYNKTPYELMQDKKLDLSFFHVFVALCYPTNDNDDLGKLDAKADIGIFIGYVPAKKAFIIYNKRTWKIIEIIHVTFDELTAMAFEHFSLGPRLYSMTPATSSSRLVPNPVLQQPCIPPNRDDWDHLFQPMFDEYFPPPLVAVSPDAPTSSTPSTQEQEQSPSISQGFEESPKTLIFRDDPLNECSS
ncbi:retrovirus-related pol polyprotein from transposon TNT 1-94 [Tanacetum coccineum]